MAGLYFEQPRAWFARTHTPHWTAETLIWRVYVALSSGKIQYAVLDGGDDRRRWGLARQIGQVFYRYGLYRPQMVTAWLAGEGSADDWQPALLRAVVRDGATGTAIELPSRVMLFAVDGLPEPIEAALERLNCPVDRFGWPRDDLALDQLQTNEVEVHGAPGPLRQAEVLRERLWTRFNADPSLEPRDILVLCRDVARYGPFLRAAFAIGAGDAPRLPTDVSGYGLRAISPTADALIRLLELVGSRYTASAVLDLLALGPVRTRYRLNDERLAWVRARVGEAGIRWGIDALHRAFHGQPPHPDHTWQAGLDRLLLGQSIGAVDDEVFGIAPHPGIEGRRDRAALGGLVDFCAALFATDRSLAEPRAARVWRRTLLGLLDTFMEPEKGDDDRTVRAQLDVLFPKEFNEVLLSRDVVQAILSEVFQAPQPGRRALAGGVTVAELTSGAGLPARVVCIVGLDDDEGYANQPGFDLLSSSRPGDPDRRRERRAAVHRAMQAAEDAVILTYDDRDPVNGRERPPDTALAEVIEQLGPPVSHHRLHPYDPRAVDIHSPQVCAGAEALRKPVQPRRPFITAPIESPPIEMLDIDVLVTFFQHPLRAFFKQTLGTRLDRYQEDTTDLDPVALGGLDIWKIANSLLERGRRGVDLDQTGGAFRATRGSGALPPGTPGESTYARARGWVEPILKTTRALATGLRTAIDVDVSIEGIRLVGRIDGIYGSGRVITHVSRTAAKHRLAAWIRHLALHTTNNSLFSGWTHLVGRPRVERFSPPREDPAHLLRTLLRMYRAGLATPLLLYPAASEALVKSLRGRSDRISMRRAQERALDRWNGFDGPDVYQHRLFGDRGPFDLDDRFPKPINGDFTTIAQAVFGPLLAHLEIG